MSVINKQKIRELLSGGLLYLIITICFYVYAYINYNMVYGINDDWTLYMVISGSYLGYPEPRVNYMMYPLAKLLSILYGITSNIPWYGIMLQGLIALCGFFLFFRIYYCTKNGIKRYLYSAIGLILFFVAHIGIVVAIQFTQVGAICGATAIFLFLTANTKEKNGKQYLIANIPTIIMATFSLNIRENTLYMCLPIAGMIFIAKWFVEDGKITKEIIKKYSSLIVTLGIFLGGTILSHKIAYSSPEWKEYVRINDNWTIGWDYYGFPEYDDIDGFLTENGMTKADYEISLAFQTFYRGELQYSEYLKTITDIAKEKYDAEHTFDKKIKNANEKIVSSLTQKSLRPLNLMVVYLFLIVLVLVLECKSYKINFTLLCYLFGRFFAWYFLLFAGRFPERIAQGLFSMDIMVLLGFLIYFKLDVKSKVLNKEWMYNMTVIISAVVFIMITWSGNVWLEEIQMQTDVHQKRWYAIKEYCQNHTENRYFLSGGSQTLFYFSDKIFETDTIGKTQNFYTNSNFDSPSPNFYDMMGAEYGSYLGDDMIEQENNYWIYEKGCFSDNVDIVKFYKTEYENFVYELVDTFEAEGTSFEVYHFSN